MNKNLLIVGACLIVLAAVGLYAARIGLAPKAQSNDELLAAVMEDWPDEIPASELALMTEVRFHMPGFD